MSPVYACNVGEFALLGRHPQIGGSGIKDDLKGLRWRTDGDFAIVLGVLEVRDLYGARRVANVTREPVLARHLTRRRFARVGERPTQAAERSESGHIRPQRARLA